MSVDYLPYLLIVITDNQLLTFKFYQKEKN